MKLKMNSSDLNASFKKFGQNVDQKDKINCEFLFDLKYMFSILEKKLSCKVCNGEITLNEEVEYGLQFNVYVLFVNCSKLASFKSSNKIGSTNNNRYIYATRSIGMGFAAMKLFAGIMDLPKYVSKIFYYTAIK